MMWKWWHHFPLMKISFTTRLEQTNAINLAYVSEGGFIQEEEKAVAGWEDRETYKNSWSSKDKVESGVYGLSRPPKKTGGKETDEVDTTTNTSRASVLIFENTTQTITNLSKNEKVPNTESTIEEHETIVEFCLGIVNIN